MKPRKREGNVLAPEYSEWRRTLGGGLYCSDVDWVEYRGVGGGLRVVGLVETTFYDYWPGADLEKMLMMVMERWESSGTYEVYGQIARALGVRVYLAVICRDLSVFHVFRMADKARRDMDRTGYERWLRQLGGEV